MKKHRKFRPHLNHPNRLNLKISRLKSRRLNPISSKRLNKSSILNHSRNCIAKFVKNPVKVVFSAV
ncbi:hypothetical protein [Rodentibacter caecimuris]|uniref:hypothetical protein n=1 Tax=Rodentibacter caecimuris TaxID=1796644 RepID=UPI003AF32802